MTEPYDLRFTSTHEWIAMEGKTRRCGISEYAQFFMGDITRVDLPEPDDHHYEEGEEIGTVESLKTSLDLHMPVGGRITAVNTRLLSNPEIINEDAYDAGWIFEIKPDKPSAIEELMDIDEYEADIPDDYEEE